MVDRESIAKAIMGYDLADLATVYPGDEHNWRNALRAADRVVALLGHEHRTPGMPGTVYGDGIFVPERSDVRDA